MSGNVTFVFRNGVVFHAKADSLTLEHNRVTKELVSLGWKNMKPDPYHLELAEVVAVFWEETEEL